MITKIVLYKVERDAAVRVTLYRFLGITLFREIKDECPSNGGQHIKF